MVSGNNNGNSAEDPSYNCLNWLNNLKWTYKKFQEKLREERTKKPAAFGSDGGDAKSTMYQTLLEQLISDRNLSSSLWCGPYYECSSSSETASMSAMTSASSNPFKLRSLAPNADGSSSSASSSSSVLSSFRSPLNLFGGASSNANNKNWVLIYSLPLFDIDDNERRLRGAVLVKFKLNQLDVNQCDQGDPVFASTHKCNANSECVHIGAQAFKSGNYYCRCNKGRYHFYYFLCSVYAYMTFGSRAKAIQKSILKSILIVISHVGVCSDMLTIDHILIALRLLINTSYNSILCILVGSNFSPIFLKNYRWSLFCIDYAVL